MSKKVLLALSLAIAGGAGAYYLFVVQKRGPGRVVEEVVPAEVEEVREEPVLEREKPKAEKPKRASLEFFGELEESTKKAGVTEKELGIKREEPKVEEEKFEKTEEVTGEEKQSEETEKAEQAAKLPPPISEEDIQKMIEAAKEIKPEDIDEALQKMYEQMSEEEKQQAERLMNELNTSGISALLEEMGVEREEFIDMAKKMYEDLEKSGALPKDKAVPMDKFLAEIEKALDTPWSEISDLMAQPDEGGENTGAVETAEKEAEEEGTEES